MKFTASRITWIGPSGSMVSARPGHQTVALLGEMDISTAPACRDQLNHALDAAAADHRQLIIDLSGVSFCDASGLSTLVAAQNRARSLATTVSLAAPCPLLVKLLHITGLDRGLAVHTTIADAIKALHTCAGPPKARLGVSWPVRPRYQATGLQDVHGDGFGDLTGDLGQDRGAEVSAVNTMLEWPIMSCTTFNSPRRPAPASPSHAEGHAAGSQ